ncbi:hypothetical protein M8J76_003611 [Diaphorina citri]|nr:hypothetical protein M8J75_014849 [Diaphorina citri]KAI5744589.1 hypothetical protein M8J76_003611 [Diaphorina citri]
MERFKVVKSENSKKANSKAKKSYGSTKYEEVKTGVQADLLELRSFGVEAAGSQTTEVILSSSKHYTLSSN